MLDFSGDRVDLGGGSGGGLPTAGSGTITASRTVHGTLPAMVEIEGSTTAGFSGFDQDRELFWVTQLIGDPLSDFTLPNIPDEWRDPNIQYGRKPRFFLPDANTQYDFYMWCVSQDGTVVSQPFQFSVTTGSIEASYPGTDTICLDPSGTFTGKPTGAQEVTTVAGLVSALDAATSGKAVLIARGSDISDFELDEKDYLEHVGAFGTGDRPILRPRGSGNTLIDISGSLGNESSISRFTVVSIDARGPWEAQNETGRLVDVFNTLHTSCPFAILYDCRFSGWRRIQLHLHNSNAYIVGLCDCEITSWIDYGFYHPGNELSRLALVGCDVAQHVDALNGGHQTERDDMINMQGPVRLSGAYEHFQCSSTSFFSRGGWSGGNDQPCLRLNAGQNEDDEFYLDRITAEAGGVIAQSAGSNSGVTENRVSAVVDKAIFLASTKTGREHFLSHSGGIDFRNVLCIIPNVANTNDVSFGISIKFNPDNPSANNLAAPVRVLSSTYLNLREVANDDGDDPTLFTASGGSFTDFTENHNVEHAPNITASVDGGLTTGANFSGFVARYKGERPNFDFISGTLSGQSSFNVNYPSGTDQAYWQGLPAENYKHMMRVDGSMNYAAPEFGADFSVTFNASNITITKASGTWSGSYKLRLDRHTAIPAADSNFASPAAVPIPRPSAGTDDTGIIPYDDLFGTPRPQSNETNEDHLGNALATTGNEAGAVLAL